MRGYETQDVDVRRIFWISVFFIVIGALIYVAVWWMFIFYRDRYARIDVRQTLIDTPPQLPPEPRLQVNPPTEWEQFRETQQRLLSTYGWVSREQRRVRIPIEKAMEMVAAEGGTNVRERQ